MIRFKFVPLNSSERVTITLRNELGISVPLVLDRNKRGDIFSAIKRDGGHCDDSTDIAWLG